MVNSTVRYILIFLVLIFLQDTIGWRVASSPSPDPRYVNQIVGSPQGNLLFGGKHSSNDGFNDLWLWNEGQWTKIGEGATARWDHASAYIPEVQSFIIFGGRNFKSVGGNKVRADLDDTWKYANQSWTKLNISGPKARSSHSMVYNQFARHLVLFGGRNKDGLLSDTWIFDGTSWSQQNAPGPSPRFSHSMAYDPKSKAVYLFGGHDGNQLLNDLWMFSDNQWTELSTKPSPSPRMAHAMIFDNAGNGLMVGGWAGKSASKEIWKFNQPTWTKLSLSNTPPARFAHALGFDQIKNEFILFGGSTGFGEGFRIKTWTLSNKVFDR